MKNATSIRQLQQPLPQQIIGEFNGYTAEVCLDPNSLRTACRLRYRAYLAADAINVNKTKMVMDKDDDQPGSFVFLVWYEGKPVATIRSCVYAERYNWEPTEAVGYFYSAINICLGQNQPLIESNRFAVDPDFQGRQSLFAQLLLFRMHSLNALAHNCENIITAVRTKHVSFYRRFLGMTQISNKSKYVEWADAYVALLACKRTEAMNIALTRGLPAISSEDVEGYVQLVESRYSYHEAA